MYAYKKQMINQMKLTDHRKNVAFAVEVLNKIDEDDNYLKRVLFTDKATFNVSGVVN